MEMVRRWSGLDPVQLETCNYRINESFLWVGYFIKIASQFYNKNHGLLKEKMWLFIEVNFLYKTGVTFISMK